MRTDEAKWLMTGANDSRKDYRLHLCKVELRTLANHLRSVRANAANWSRNRSTATTTDTSRKLQCPKAQGVPRSMGRCAKDLSLAKRRVDQAICGQTLMYPSKPALTSSDALNIR